MQFERMALRRQGFVGPLAGLAGKPSVVSVSSQLCASFAALAEHLSEHWDGGKGGWIVRAEEFISAHFHLTRAQHDERTRAWG